MSDASQLIAQQIAAAGVTPSELTPVGSVTKTYVDAQDAALQAGIQSAAGVGAAAQQTANLAQTSATAAQQTANQAKAAADTANQEIYNIHHGAELDIQNGAIVNRHLRNESVTTAKLAQKAVTRDRIATGAIGRQEVDPELLQDYNNLPVAAKLNELDDRLDEISVNVTQFGALGDGVTDDTAAINSAIQYAVSKKISRVLIPSGLYMIQGGTGSTTWEGQGGGVLIPSNISLELDEDAVLRQIPSTFTSYNIVYFDRASNSSIRGGTIDGNRSNYLATSGEWGYGIGVYSSKNISIQGVICKNCWGDGINIQVNKSVKDSNIPEEDKPCKNVLIDNVICDNNRRQGMSIESVIGITVFNSSFNNTNGTAPNSGIDIEPFDSGKMVRDVLIEGCRFENNTAFGILVLKTYTNGVKIDKCVFKNNKSAEGQVSIRETANVLVSGCTFISSLFGNGLKVNQSRAIKIHKNDFTDGGIYIFSSKDVDVSDNTVRFVVRTPYAMSTITEQNGISSDFIRFRNNLFTSETLATFSLFEQIIGDNILLEGNTFEKARSLGTVSGAAKTVTISKNLIRNMSVEGIGFSSGTTYVRNNIFTGICYNNNAQSILRIANGARVRSVENELYKNLLGGGDLGTGRPNSYARVEASGIAEFFDNFVNGLALIDLSTTAVVVARQSHPNWAQ